MHSSSSASSSSLVNGSVEMAGSSSAVLAFTLVTVLVPGHMLNWAVEWIWLAMICAIGLMLIASRSWHGALLGLDIGVWALLFALLSGASALSLGQTLLRQETINERDIFEMLRFPIYGLMACLLAMLALRWSIDGVDRALRISLLYSLGCAVAYHFRIPILYPILENIVYADAKVLMGTGVVRIPFPFENPNFLAYFLLFALVHFGFFRRNALYLLLGLILMFLTGSRSGWLATSLILVLLVAVELAGRQSVQRSFRRLAICVIIGACAVAMTLYWEQLKSFGRLAELVNALQAGGLDRVETARIRLEGVARLFDWMSNSPILGWGPGRAIEIDVADNQFLSWAVAWGWLGISLITLIGALLTTRLFVASHTDLHRAGMLAMGAALVVMLSTGDFLENYRLFFLTLILLHTFYEMGLHSKDEPIS